MGITFRELKIWQKGYDLLLVIYKLTGKFPQSERLGLVNQLRRSANSIIANIAESHGRYHFADKCRVLYQARGECVEVQSHLSVSRGLGLLSEENFKLLDKEYEGLSVGINFYISSLKRKT